MNYRNWIFITLTVLLLLATSVILLRQPLLDFAINKATEKFQERYNAKLEIKDARIHWVFRDVYIKNLSLVPETGDTLFTFEKLESSDQYFNAFKNEGGFS